MLLLCGATAAAQEPAPAAPPLRQSLLPPGDRLQFMQTVAAALGVECEYCHGQRGVRGAPTPMTSAGKPRLQVAREMFLMVEDINAAVQAATSKPASDVTRVQCITCHRGVAIPRPLSEILTTTAVHEGPEAAVAQFRDLRTRYYGRQAYDFSEASMAMMLERLASIRPDAASAVMKANIEFYPQSSISYTVLGIAQTRMADFQGAIASLRKALELDPDNNNARGRLAQLDSQSHRLDR